MASAALIAQRFAEHFGQPPVVVASAPGRVNLIGEHTDYNDGYVLPMAIEARAWVGFAVRDDGVSDVRSVQFPQPLRLAPAECDRRPRSAWHDVARGMLCELQGLPRDDSASASPVCRLAVPHAPHLGILIDSDVPQGSGLSSSAAVEMALARAYAAVEGVPWVPLEMARLAQRVEHDYVGVRSGLMDQIVSAAAQEGSAMLIDCRDFAVERVTMPADVAIVVMDTGVRRTLSVSEYNARRAACEGALAEIRRVDHTVRALRDVDDSLLARAARAMSEVQHRRARHVVSEIERVKSFAPALTAGDYAVAGALMNASHASLRHDYEVSSVHLDLLTGLARDHAACFGARLTGAGFGGCAIALVRADAADAFVADVRPRYEAASYSRSRFFTARPSAGARIDARTGTPERRGGE